MSDQQSIASTSRPGSPVGPLPDFANNRPYRFAWDGASRKQGPPSVSGTSEGRADYFAYKPTLGNLNFSSASLALGSIPQEWSSAKLGFNAISNLVNSPQKKPAPPKAHAAVPPIITSQLPRVRRKDFDAYLTAIGPEWEQFERNQQLQNVQDVGFPLSLSALSPTSPISPLTPRPFLGPTLPPLESVPKIFSSPGFELSDPRTFAAVTEQNGDEQDVDPSALAHSLPLLEKLSHYADTVEQHLVREISIRSSSFFAALTNLNELQTESSQCLDRVRSLRATLKEVDEKGAKKGLKVIQMEKKLQNLGDVQEAVKSMKSVGELLGVAKNLAHGGELGAALGVVEELDKAWNPSALHDEQAATANPRSKPPSRTSTLDVVPESPVESRQGSKSEPAPLPISSLNVFASLPQQLRELTLEIASSLTSEVVDVLKIDLITVMETRTEQSGVENDRSILELRDRLRPLLESLRRTQGIRNAVHSWRDVVLVQIRASVKQYLPNGEELDDDEGTAGSHLTSEKGAALRTRLRSMSHLEFLTLIRSIYNVLLHCIQRLQTQNTIITEVLQSQEQYKRPEDLSDIQTDLLEILSSGVELAHSRVSKVMSIRTEQHAALDLPEFMTLFRESWDFVVQTETTCRRMIVGLRGTVLSQGKAFLQTMHQARISASAKVVEEEQWSATDVSPASQALANIIIDSAMSDSAKLRIGPDNTQNGHANGVATAASAKQLSIEDVKYYAVPATLKMFEFLVDYLKVIVNLPLLTTDSVGRIIEFLKAFNSRTCQVVLGAGAMRSAGLKNITAKNLALASQSLSIVIALIPYVRECFRRHLNPKQAVMLVEFDKLKRDYQEHQQELHAKLVAIMGDRLTAHCKSLQAVDWNLRRESVNEYMAVLVKETVTLHKVLTRYLQESASEYVMSQVFASINHRLSEEYGKIELPSQEAKDRLSRDVKYLHQHLSGLKGIVVSTSMLETIVNDKSIPRLAQEVGSPARPSTPVMVTTTTNEPARSSPPISPPQPQHSAFESTNQRLKSIFRRSTMLERKDSENKDNARSASSVPMSPPEKKETLDLPRVASPPPTPPKLERLASPPPQSSSPKPSTGSRRSSYMMDKELPTPMPIPVPSNSEGDDEKGTSVAPSPSDQPQDSSNGNGSMISARPAELGSTGESLLAQESSDS